MAVRQHPKGKLGNEYADSLGIWFFMDCPKAVFAAIAVSVLTVGGDYLNEAQARILKEWDILYQNGIVPQPVPAKYRAMMIEPPAHDRDAYS